MRSAQVLDLETISSEVVRRGKLHQTQLNTLAPIDICHESPPLSRRALHNFMLQKVIKCYLRVSDDLTHRSDDGITRKRLSAFPLPAGGERVRVRGLPDLRSDFLQDAFEVGEDLAIPDTNYPISESRKTGIAVAIGWVVGMLAAAHLNDQMLLTAHEVDEIWPDRLLAREFDLPNRRLRRANHSARSAR